jgi:hypothetical protein
MKKYEIFKGGWVKLYRKILNSKFYKDRDATSVAVHCLLRANYTEHRDKLTKIKVNEGSLLISLRQLARELNLPLITVYRKLKLLEKLNFLKYGIRHEHLSIPLKNMKRRYSIISIVKYKEYQGEGEK